MIKFICFCLFCISTSIIAAPDCFNLESKETLSLKFDPALKSQFLIVNSTYGENSFYCEKDGQGHNCSGDDDGGEFSILNGREIQVKYLRLGEVSKKYKVLKQTDFKISKLQKSTCKK